MSDPLPLVIANHKANINSQNFDNWLNSVGPIGSKFQGTIILCPSSPYLSLASWLINSSNWKLKLGSQDVSVYEQGAYTGEVAASQLTGFCQYAIIGHSERRRLFKETDEQLEDKVKNVLGAHITPIFCVQDENTRIPNGVGIVAYEPIFAIGTGNPDTPQNAKEVSAKIKSKGNFTVLYGGSVKSDNVKSYVESGVLDGVLVGSASLDPQEFITIVNNIL